VGVEPTLSDKAEKIRISVTLTKQYIDALDHLVEEGIYLGRGEAILEALRNLLRGYGVEPFAAKFKNKEKEPD